MAHRPTSSRNASRAVARCCCRQLCLGAAVLLMAGCSARMRHDASDNRLPVFAGIPPVAYLVEQIGAGHVAVDVLVEPNQDPHTFEPAPQQVRALAKATIFFKIGMPFEGVLLTRIRQEVPKLRVIDVGRGIERRKLKMTCFDESPGDGHDDGAEADPHVWLSPPLLIVMANNIASALCEADAAHAKEYRRNLAALVDRVGALHRRITAEMAPFRGRSFYVFHPSFGYFADAYGLKQVPVETGGREPTPKELRALTDKARSEGAGTIFVRPQSSQQGAQAVADAIGGKTVAISGLGKDVLADIEDIATKIEAAMKEGDFRNHG